MHVLNFLVGRVNFATSIGSSNRMDLSLFGGQYMTYPKGVGNGVAFLIVVIILIALIVTPHED